MSSKTGERGTEVFVVEFKKQQKDREKNNVENNWLLIKR